MIKRILPLAKSPALFLAFLITAPVAAESLPETVTRLDKQVADLQGTLSKARAELERLKEKLAALPTDTAPAGMRGAKGDKGDIGPAGLPGPTGEKGGGRFGEIS